ncbi:MAG: hypothetical protein OSB69_13225 [Alphaproteobacteria bacterium]|nr:hypothetical protein [Alphaproteobacteria bacterium]
MYLRARFTRTAPETKPRQAPGEVVIFIIDITSRRDLEERMI